MINTIKQHHKKPERVEEVIAFVRESCGIEYAIEKMHTYQAKAIEIISDLPESEFKKALHSLIKFVIDRKK